MKTLINPKNTTLIPWSGSKRAFTDKIQNTINLMNIDKVDYYFDIFGGSLNFTINNIHLFNAKNYVINDIDRFLSSTYKALKSDYKHVIYYYEKIREGFYSLNIPTELKNKNTIEAKYRKNCMELRYFYQLKVDELNCETDIFKIAALLIWKMQYTSNGMLKYNKDNTISNVNFTWNYKVRSKVAHIEYYSYILNKYDVIIEQLDVFDLLYKYEKYQANSFVYLDPGYLSSSQNYGQDISNQFHKKLINKTNDYRYRLYSNEDTQLLYRLKIDSYFNYYKTFPRNSNLGSSNSNGREFLAYSVNEPINNTYFIPTRKEVA